MYAHYFTVKWSLSWWWIIDSFCPRLQSVTWGQLWTAVYCPNKRDPCWPLDGIAAFYLTQPYEAHHNVINQMPVAIKALSPTEKYSPTLIGFSKPCSLVEADSFKTGIQRLCITQTADLRCKHQLLSALHCSAVSCHLPLNSDLPQTKHVPLLAK